MVATSQLVREIDSLPIVYRQEILNFIEYLKVKQSRSIPETMLLCEKSLAKEWDTQEEDEAWADL